MSLFRLDASIQGPASTTKAIADTLQTTWLGEHPGATVVARDLGAEPLGALVWQTSVFAGFAPEDSWTAEQREARAVAATLADELVAADSYLFAVPLYNWGVTASFKTWFDVLVTDPRFAAGTESPIKGRPGVLVLARGGGYGPGTPKEGWDHALPYMVRVLTEVLGLDLDVIEAELTLAKVVPAMEALRPIADQQLAEAHTRAEQLGRKFPAPSAA